MLALQEYLHAHGIEKLQEELAINVTRHPTLPLVLFKYNQLESTPRNHPVVRECRGIVLEEGTWKVIAKPFNRFFNVGEYEEEFKTFNWNSFDCVNKVDGSLIIVYYYDGEWHANTSGSFGLGNAPMREDTWRDLFWATAQIKVPLYPRYTYIFELCTPYNKVVKSYRRPTVFLLGVVHTAELWEASESMVNVAARRMGVPRPPVYPLTSLAEVSSLLEEFEETEELQEGVVIRDSNGLRYKWKTVRYCALHRLKDNGNVLLARRLVDIVLTGECSEVLAIMPEVTTALGEVNREISEAVVDITRTWLAFGYTESQKDFALKVKDNRFSWILFQLRKKHDWKPGPWGGIVRKIMLANSRKVSDIIFGKKVFQFDVQHPEDCALCQGTNLVHSPDTDRDFEPCPE